MIFKKITDVSEIDASYDPFVDEDLSFLKKDGIVVYGYYKYEGSNDLIAIEFGRTVTPSEKDFKGEQSIFAQLKSYGQSKRFRGLISPYGHIIIPNIYDTITLCGFISTTFIVSKNGLYGIIDIEGKIIAPISYQKLFDAGEGTIGFIKNNLMGFMDKSGREVVEAKFEFWDEWKPFSNGFAEVCIREDGIRYKVITDHYGIISEQRIKIDYEPYIHDYDYDDDFHNMGTGYYPYGELPDSLDAYEGDESNRWNTD